MNKSLNKELTEDQKEKHTKNHTKDLKNTPNNEDLQKIINAWENLPEPVKAGIMAMVKEIINSKNNNS